MALTDIYGTPLGREIIVPNSASATTQVCDANNDGLGAIFLAPKAGNISKIGVRCSSVTGTPPTYRVALEGTADTKSPDGTVKGSGTAKYDIAAISAGFAWYTLDTAFAVSAGDKLAATFRYQSGTIDASNCATMALRYGHMVTGWNAPFSLTLTGGTWAAVTYPPAFGVQYDDGSIVLGMCPFSGLTSQTWSSAGSPLYRGTLWTPAFGCRLIGALVVVRTATGSDFILELFTGTGASATASRSVDESQDWAGVAGAAIAFIPLTPTTLSSGTAYRLTIRPTTATAINAFMRMEYLDRASMRAVLADFVATTCDSPGTWTDYNNGTDGYYQYGIIPVIDQIDVAAASGGGFPILGGSVVR